MRRRTGEVTRLSTRRASFSDGEMQGRGKLSRLWHRVQILILLPNTLAYFNAQIFSLAGFEKIFPRRGDIFRLPPFELGEGTIKSTPLSFHPDSQYRQTVLSQKSHRSSAPQYFRFGNRLKKTRAPPACFCCAKAVEYPLAKGSRYSHRYTPHSRSERSAPDTLPGEVAPVDVSSPLHHLQQLPRLPSLNEHLLLIFHCC